MEWKLTFIKIAALFGMVWGVQKIKPDHVTPVDTTGIALFSDVTYEGTQTNLTFRIDSTWEVRDNKSNELVAEGRWNGRTKNMIGLRGGCAVVAVRSSNRHGELIKDPFGCIGKKGTVWMEFSPHSQFGNTPSLWNIPTH